MLIKDLCKRKLQTQKKLRMEIKYDYFYNFCDEE